jgi:DNA mismatch repair ATPase MutL
MLKSSSEEYTKMVDCVMKMALRNAHVAFTLKRDAQLEPMSTQMEKKQQLFYII